MYSTCNLLIQWDSSYIGKKTKIVNIYLSNINKTINYKHSIENTKGNRTDKTLILKSNYAALVFRSWVSHFSRWWQWICDFALRLRSNFWSVTIWFRFTFKPYTATYMLIVHVHLSHAFMYKQEIQLFQNFIVQKYSSEDS